MKSAQEQQMSTRIIYIINGHSKATIDSIDVELFGKGLLDSANMIELLLGLEEAFDIAFTDDDLDISKFASVRAIANLISAKLEHSSEPVGQTS